MLNESKAKHFKWVGNWVRIWSNLTFNIIFGFKSSIGTLRILIEIVVFEIQIVYDSDSIGYHWQATTTDPPKMLCVRPCDSVKLIKFLRIGGFFVLRISPL